jgi:hypothetical protein
MSIVLMTVFSCTKEINNPTDNTSNMNNDGIGITFKETLKVNNCCQLSVVINGSGGKDITCPTQ